MTARSIFLFLVIFLLVQSCAVAASPIIAHGISGISQAECDRLKVRGVLADNAPVDCEKLAIVRFSHVDFEGRTHHDGEIMVMMAAADFVKTIFDTLYSRKFPIARARLMDHYLGNDLVAMQDNNTSAFNHRPVSGGKLPSLHAYGLAIDLNPVQNPYISILSDGQAVISPTAGAGYANRLDSRPGKQARSGMAEEVVALFAENGFLVWGGYWDAPIDYQHFQVERKLAEQMAKLPVREARAVFTDHVRRYRTCMKATEIKVGSNEDARIDCLEMHRH